MISLRMPRVISLMTLAACVALAQDEPGKSAAAPKPSPKKEAIEKLLSERGTPSEFDKAVASAKKLGVSEQAILEGRFLYLVDRHDDDKLVGLLPQFLERKDKFNLEESEIFAVPEDWQAVVEYIQALASLKKGDKDGFKKHITEAFWLSPRQGSAFASHIDRLRLDEAMKQTKLDLSLSLELLDGGSTTIASLAKDQKGVLLHFWSPWSEDCEASMPDFKAVAVEMAKNQIAVASVLVDPGPEVIPDAKAVVASLGEHPLGAWLKGEAASTLIRKLRIQTVPTMVLVSTEGAVLYNGDPSDEELWNSLHRLAPELKRPSMSEK